MDLATILGFLGAAGVVAGAMVVGGNPLVFVNVPSLLIVFVGSLLIVLMQFSFKEFFGAIKVALKAFFFKLDKPEDIIVKTVELAEIGRKEGLLALENVEIDNEFLAKGVQLLVDGHDATVVEEMLTNDMEQTVARHKLGSKIFDAWGDVAPAMGMIGTLVGLVQMLAAMDDPKSIGPAMAVALLTTLYGAMISNMFAFPISDKLKMRSQAERSLKQIIIDAVNGIQKGQNPRVIEQALHTYLPPSVRGSMAQEPQEA